MPLLVVFPVYTFYLNVQFERVLNTLAPRKQKEMLIFFFRFHREDLECTFIDGGGRMCSVHPAPERTDNHTPPSKIAGSDTALVPANVNV
jgi:hypothetical protein